MSAWSGIRPLVLNPNKGSTEALARNHVLHVSNSNLITMAGIASILFLKNLMTLKKIKLSKNFFLHFSLLHKCNSFLFCILKDIRKNNLCKSIVMIVH